MNESLALSRLSARKSDPSYFAKGRRKSSLHWWRVIDLFTSAFCSLKKSLDKLSLRFTFSLVSCCLPIGRAKIWQALGSSTGKWHEENCNVSNKTVKRAKRVTKVNCNPANPTLPTCPCQSALVNQALPTCLCYPDRRIWLSPILQSPPTAEIRTHAQI